jgi:hypothetical protein
MLPECRVRRSGHEANVPEVCPVTGFKLNLDLWPCDSTGDLAEILLETMSAFD